MIKHINFYVLAHRPLSAVLYFAFFVCPVKADLFIIKTIMKTYKCNETGVCVPTCK